MDIQLLEETRHRYLESIEELDIRSRVRRHADGIVNLTDHIWSCVFFDAPAVPLGLPVKGYVAADALLSESAEMDTEALHAIRPLVEEIRNCMQLISESPVPRITLGSEIQALRLAASFLPHLITNEHDCAATEVSGILTSLRLAFSALRKTVDEP